MEDQVNRLTINPLKYLSSLPEFHGDPRDLQTFTTLIDRIHPHLRTYDETTQLLFSDIIKSKFKGKARQTIEINCHATSWTDIKSILQNNFGDRRSCEELFDELRGVTFKTTTLDFYNDIKSKLHRLNNKLIVILGESGAARQSALNNMHTALNIFKSKIPEPMKSILFCRNPDDLEQAMDILFQAGYAYAGIGNKHPTGNNSIQPNRRGNHRFRNNTQQRYHQQPPHNQQQFHNQQSSRNHQANNDQRQYRNLQQPFQNPRNQQNPNLQNNLLNPRYQPAVEPMDINNHEIIGDNFPLSASDTYHI